MIPTPFALPPTDYSAMHEDTAREWWRWHFAGRLAAALWPEVSTYVTVTVTRDDVAMESVQRADALIAALEADREEQKP